MTHARPFTGTHMLTIMLAFFGVIFTANMTLVYFANKSWTGLVVPNSYVASQTFDADTKALKEASADVRFVLAYHAGVIAITLTDSAGATIDDADVRVTLGRPTTDGADQTHVMVAKGAGRYETSHALSLGQWPGMATIAMTGRKPWQRPILINVGD